MSGLPLEGAAHVESGSSLTANIQAVRVGTAFDPSTQEGEADGVSVSSWPLWSTKQVPGLHRESVSKQKEHKSPHKNAKQLACLLVDPRFSQVDNLD